MVQQRRRRSTRVHGVGEHVALARAERALLAEEVGDDAIGRVLEAQHAVQQLGRALEQGVRMHRGDYPAVPRAMTLSGDVPLSPTRVLAEQLCRTVAMADDAVIAAAAARRPASAPRADRAGARCASTRAASVASCRRRSTGTTACAMIGPWSRSAVTKCTVAPLSLAARLDRAPVRVQARERRQQRRMDVDEAAVVAAHEARRRGCA